MELYTNLFQLEIQDDPEQFFFMFVSNERIATTVGRCCRNVKISLQKTQT